MRKDWRPRRVAKLLVHAQRAKPTPELEIWVTTFLEMEGFSLMDVCFAISQKPLTRDEVSQVVNISRMSVCAILGMLKEAGLIGDIKPGGYCHLECPQGSLLEAAFDWLGYAERADLLDRINNLRR